MFRLELVGNSLVRLLSGDGIYTVEVIPIFDVDIGTSKEFLLLNDAEEAFDSIVDRLTEKLLYL